MANNFITSLNHTSNGAAVVVFSELTGASTGTQFIKATGERWIKTTSGVYNKLDQTILNRGELDATYGQLAIDNAWGGNQSFGGNITASGTNTFSGITSFTGSAFNVSAPLNSSGSNTWSALNTFSGGLTSLGVFTASTTSSFGGSMNIGSPGVTGTLTVDFPIISNQANGWHGHNTFDGNITSSGTNVFSGLNTFDGTLQINGTFASTGVNAWSASNTFSGGLTVSGSLSSTSTASFTGNVTIGTPTGTSTLTIDAPITSSKNNTWTGYNTLSNCTVGLMSSNTITPNVPGVPDIGSVALHWRNGYFSNLLSAATMNAITYNVNRDGSNNSTVTFKSSTGVSRYLGIVNNTFQLVDAGLTSRTIMHSGNIGAQSVTNSINSTNSTNSDIHRNDGGTTGQATKLITFSSINSTDASTQVRVLEQSNKFSVNSITGTMTATLFSGTATAARYADVAEKYTTDIDYPVGTVVEVNTLGNSEITLFSGGSLAGVISGDPGVMLNADGVGLYVALKGKVPVKCKRQITKGDFCIAEIGGTVFGVTKANALLHPLDIVGVALEDSNNGTVMVKI